MYDSARSLDTDIVTCAPDPIQSRLLDSHKTFQVHTRTECVKSSKMVTPYKYYNFLQGLLAEVAFFMRYYKNNTDWIVAQWLAWSSSI